MYDENNVFARIIRKEIPAKIVYEDDDVLAFEDVAPAAPVHILVIPKGSYTSFHDFMGRASEIEIKNFFSAILNIAKELNLEINGYRILSNVGREALQTVHHFHFHLLAGKPLGGILAK